MKIWITGAQGFVGKTLKQFLGSKNIACIATGHHEVDITSGSQIEQFFKEHSDITHIINCAAYTKVDEAEKKTEEAFKINAIGPENLGKFAATHGLKLIHLSTDYVFGSENKIPFKETDRCEPTSVYAKTKHEGELRLLQVFPSACIVRTSWVFGRGGQTFISSLLNKLQQEKTIKVVDDQINKMTYVVDLAEAILALLPYSGIYHFANQGIISRYDVAQAMKWMLQEKRAAVCCEEIEPISASNFLVAAPRPTFSAMDTQKIEQTIGIKPRFWKEALKEYIDEQFS